MKKVLLTGVAGFIGSHLAAQLLESGVTVVGVDNLNDYYDPRLKQHRLAALQKTRDFSFETLDIESADGLERLFQRHKFDVVFNLAARAGVGYSMIHPQVYFTTNVMGTLNLLQLMVRFKVPKIVLASTSSVYAGEALPFNEDAPVNRPISPYAASKKAAEHICYTYHYHFGIDCTVVRYFTVFGPAGRPDMSILRFIRWIDEGTPLELFGDGEQTRDFTYVQDIARGTLKASTKLGFEIINLGGGRTPVSMNEVIRHIEKSLGKMAKVDFKPELKADIRETQADIGKAKRMLAWEPEVDFREGLDRTLKWYQENRTMVMGLKL